MMSNNPNKAIFFYLPLLWICFIISPALAEETKDSYYFMKDGSDFSPEEKDEEALYVYGQCENNIFQKTYFDCGCIAGAYRQERDNGPLIPQNTLLNSLYTNNQRGCTNTVAIAGDAYEFCDHYAKIYRKREKNNEQYCECVANTVARSFAKTPHLKLGYIGGLRTDALLSCKKTTAPTRTNNNYN